MNKNKSEEIDFYRYFDYRSITRDIINDFDVNNVVILEQAIKDKESNILPKYYTKLYLLPSDIRQEFVKNEIERTVNALGDIDFYFNEILISAYFNEEDIYSPEDIAFSWLDLHQIAEYKKFYDDSFNILISKKWNEVTLPKFIEVVNAIINIKYLTMLRWHWSLLKKGRQILVKNPVTHISHSLNEEQLQFIYNSFTRKLDLIDDIRTTYSDFTNVFNKGFNETNSKIYWSGETKQVAHLLGLLKKEADYTYISIEKSQKFITKDNTVLTATNISKGISDSKVMRPKDAELIEDILKSMPKQ